MNVLSEGQEVKEQEAEVSGWPVMLMSDWEFTKSNRLVELKNEDGHVIILEMYDYSYLKGSRNIRAIVLASVGEIDLQKNIEVCCQIKEDDTGMLYLI